MFTCMIIYHMIVSPLRPTKLIPSTNVINIPLENDDYQHLFRFSLGELDHFFYELNGAYYLVNEKLVILHILYNSRNIESF